MSLKKHRDDEPEPEPENSDGEAENGWVVYNQEVVDVGPSGESTGDGLIIHHERIILDDKPSSIRSPLGGSMMASYLNITSYPASASEPSPTLLPSSSSSTPFSPQLLEGRTEFEFHAYDDHDRSLPSMESTQDYSSASIQQMKENNTLQSEIVTQPEENSTTITKFEWEHHHPPSTQQEISPQDANLQQESQQGPHDLEWWRRINGYGLAALVVGTASIVAYSMARQK